MTDFYLVSTELREPYEPRACRMITRLRSDVRDDLALVEIDPPLPRQVYETTEEIKWLILGSRHQGTSLFPVSEWPLPVYICRTKGSNNPPAEKLVSETLAIVDWGEIRQRRA